MSSTSTFTESEQVVLEQQQQTDRSSYYGHRSVLIVDDSPTDTHLLSEMLKKTATRFRPRPMPKSGIAKSKQENQTDPDGHRHAGHERLRGHACHYPRPGDFPSRSSLSPPSGQETDKAWGMRQGEGIHGRPIAEQALLGEAEGILAMAAVSQDPHCAGWRRRVREAPGSRRRPKRARSGPGLRSVWARCGGVFRLVLEGFRQPP